MFREGATSLSMSNSYKEKLLVNYTHFDSDYDVTYLIPLRSSNSSSLMTAGPRKKINLDDIEIPLD